MGRSPDIDCVFLNAGIQGKYDVSKPETIDLQAVKLEFDTNFMGILALSNAFLPFMENKSNIKPASIIL